MRFPKFIRQALVPVLTTSLVGCSVVPKKEFCSPPICPTSPAPISGLDSYLKLEDPCLTECFADDPNQFEVNPNEVDLSNTFPLTLEQCIQTALQNTTILRDIGGSVVRAPQQVDSIHLPAIVYADPRIGEEAALAAFDATLSARAGWDKNDRAFNNSFVGNGGVLQEDLGDYRMGVNKRSATGTMFGLNSVTNYDFNNSIANRFGTPSSSWDTYLSAEVRQPLLQGAGSEFNRIAGPLSDPGSPNGLLIARTNTDISLAQFEEGLRDFVSDVENAYWDLYFAYKDLEAKIDARDKAALVWNTNLSNPDSTTSQRTQAEEQYHRFQAEVLNALHGRLIGGTQTNAGLSSGAFQARGGVRVAERRLRLMMGMQINDSQLILPVETPLKGEVAFDWLQARSECLTLRPELRKQRWVVKRSELELVAAKNHLLPRLDALANYRLRGFGNSLSGGYVPFAADPNGDPNAVADMLSGDHQEWTMGVELNMPIGYRKAHAAVRNAELGLARQRALLREQERTVIHGLSAAMGELQRAAEVREAVALNLKAAYEQLAAVSERVDSENEKIDVELEAQRILVDAQIRYAQAQVEYMLALKGVHYEKGTLLEYNNILLTERDWVAKATLDASLREALRGEHREGRLNYVISGGEAGSNLHHQTYEVLPGEMLPAEMMPTEMLPIEEGSSIMPMGEPTPVQPVPQPMDPAAMRSLAPPVPVISQGGLSQASFVPVVSGGMNGAPPLPPAPVVIGNAGQMPVSNDPGFVSIVPLPSTGTNSAPTGR